MDLFLHRRWLVRKRSRGKQCERGVRFTELAWKFAQRFHMLRDRRVVAT